MIFDCINEALNYARPGGADGRPFIWSSRHLDSIGYRSLGKVFGKVQTCLKRWSEVKIGEIDEFGVETLE